MIVRIDDIRKAGHCPAGIRRWFESKGLDFRAFMRDGLPASTFAELNDGQMNEVIRLKLERDRNNG